MRKYTYTFDQPLSLQTSAPNKAVADARLETFNQKLIELAYEMGFILEKGRSIRCEEEEMG